MRVARRGPPRPAGNRVRGAGSRSSADQLLCRYVVTTRCPSRGPCLLAPYACDEGALCLQGVSGRGVNGRPHGIRHGISRTGLQSLESCWKGLRVRCLQTLMFEMQSRAAAEWVGDSKHTLSAVEGAACGLHWSATHGTPSLPGHIKRARKDGQQTCARCRQDAIVIACGGLVFKPVGISRAQTVLSFMQETTK